MFYENRSPEEVGAPALVAGKVASTIRCVFLLHMDDPCSVLATLQFFNRRLHLTHLKKMRKNTSSGLRIAPWDERAPNFKFLSSILLDGPALNSSSGSSLLSVVRRQDVRLARTLEP
jgi:hypothetical protein